MANTKRPAKARVSEKPRAAGTRLISPSGQPFQVKHFEAPPRYPKRERIHPRRRLPRVVEGKERAFHSTTAPILLQQAMLAPKATTGDLSLVTNTPLTQPGQQQLASSVGEPSVSINGSVVLYTGNWYAAFSTDSGKSFQFLDPFKAFPNPPNLVFCCDQVVNYIASIDTFVWLLQYGPQSGPDADNIQRLAFAKTADVAAGRWRLFDITTKALGVPGQFLDFPDLAVGANSLYVTTNVFTPQGTSAGAAVVRIPIASIAAGQPTAQRFVSKDLNSFRVVQNSKTTAFFAAHSDTSTLSVFTWPEGDAQPTSNNVGVARWIGGQGYQSRTPDGGRWLDRVDPRITGAVMVTDPASGDDEVWFAWSVDAGSNHRPNPFVQIARIDATDLTLLDNLNIFDPDSAIAYGSLASNVNSEVAISYMIGGGPRFPSHMVGILTGARKDILVAAGERSPMDSNWGDYLTARPVFPDQKLFAATGYTMNGPGDGSNRDATPRFVVFGRAADASGVAAFVTPGTAIQLRRPKPPVPPSAPSTPTEDGDPITDVNTLSVVNTAVAAKIKTACGMNVAPDADSPSMMAMENAAAPPPAEELDKPGTERWPVKTGQDQDRAKVGKNVVNGEDLGAGIVEATVEELITAPRPPGLTIATQDPPQFKSVRDGLTEVTIWRIEATIIALKHEADGDYHLVLQGSSGAEMVAEIPTPTEEFVGDSPWIKNIGAARQEVDDKLLNGLSPADFTLSNGKFVPHGAVTFQPRAAMDARLSFTTPKDSLTVQPLFATKIDPTSARITGVGFFDRAHGATGAAPNVIELHPVLKIEWI
jgi:hypothetical protein